MKFSVEEYLRDDGRSPYRDWFEGLASSKSTQARDVLRAQSLLQEYKSRKPRK